MLSVLAMSKEYFVTEPYIKWKADVRVQKIGTHYRAIERSKMRLERKSKIRSGMDTKF